LIKSTPENICALVRGSNRLGSCSEGIIICNFWNIPYYGNNNIEEIKETHSTRRIANKCLKVVVIKSEDEYHFLDILKMEDNIKIFLVKQIARVGSWFYRLRIRSYG
jgi:hypothetical protein